MSNLMKCTICGMHIHARNVMLNAETMIQKNQNDKVINCPFCGIGKSYFESFDWDLSQLHQRVSNEGLKVIENAMKLEVFNSVFYEEASKLVESKELSKILKELSFIEKTHARIHMQIGGFKELPVLHKPDYRNRENDAAFIREAEQREKHAIHYYTSKANLINEPVILNVFEALMEVEKQHQIIMDCMDTK